MKNLNEHRKQINEQMIDVTVAMGTTTQRFFIIDPGQEKISQ